ncbi:MAG: N-acetylmuramoyl-L-alanine amidase [bacterium]|nr:N-acetylmuramoyl-L-alanine amidase [bacterium]
MKSKVLILSIVLYWAQFLFSAELTVIRDQDTLRVPLKRTSNKRDLIDMVSFSKALEYATQVDSNGNWLTVKTNPQLMFKVNNPFVRYGTKIIQLKTAVQKDFDVYWVPLDWTISFFQSISIEKMEYDSRQSLLTVQPTKAVWSGVTLSKISETEAQIVLHVPRGPTVKYTVKDSLVMFEVFGATTQSKNFKIKASPGFIANNKLILDKQPHLLHLKFQSKIEKIESIDARTFKVILTPKTLGQDSKTMITPELATPSPPTDKGATKEGLQSLSVKDAQKKWLIDCIVIDAGHGGHDPGAIGNKLREKDITLDIALRLKKILSKEKTLKIVMTRETDIFIPLQDRTKIANRENGKLFLSIHVNSAKNKKARGIETYFLSPARTEKALEVAEFENQVIRLEQDTSAYQKLTDENFILLTMAQSQFIRESQDLAFLVQRTAVKRLGLEDRGVDQAGFYVLVGASMPAILFETAFISNSQDAKVLRSEAGRQAYAEALAKAILEFCNRVNSKG